MERKGKDGLVVNIGTGDAVRLRITNAPLTAGDKVIFAVREDVESEKLLEKTVTDFDGEGWAYVSIRPEDTLELGAGEFVYGVNLVRGGIADPVTLIRAAKFIVKEAVASDY